MLGPPGPGEGYPFGAITWADYLQERFPAETADLSPKISKITEVFLMMSNFGRLICYKSVIQTFNNLSADRQAIKPYMHSKDLRARGETEQRLYVLEAWREAPFYTRRERAALAWAETVTKVTEGHVPDEIYEAAREQFSEEELIDLTMAVITINSYNRVNIAFRVTAGTYQPGQYAVPTK